MAPNSTSLRCVNSQLVSLPPVGNLNLLCLICIIFVCYTHLNIFTWNLRDTSFYYCNYFFQASFLLSATEHGTQDKYELSNMVNKYQLLVYLADSLFDDEQYKRAEVYNIIIFNLDSLVFLNCSN